MGGAVADTPVEGVVKTDGQQKIQKNENKKVNEVMDDVITM